MLETFMHVSSSLHDANNVPSASPGRASVGIKQNAARRRRLYQTISVSSSGRHATTTSESKSCEAETKQRKRARLRNRVSLHQVSLHGNASDEDTPRTH